MEHAGDMFHTTWQPRASEELIKVNQTSLNGVASPEIRRVGSLVRHLLAISAAVPLTDDPQQIRCDAQQ